jgi:hypothetical protein
MSPFAAGIRQLETHSALTPRKRPRDAPLAQLELDAIVVPASRPAAHLDHAVTLARAAGCWLLILCSRRLNSTEARKFLAARSYHKVIAIDLPRGYSHDLLHFPELLSIKNELPQACSFYTTDLSMKRNLGLVLARMLKWRRIFFLDDDIRDITHPNLQSTVNMLGSFSAAGLWVTDFPDNSIVCHANRETGGAQDVFVSGAALAVDCAADIGFFPDIYNEDWLFFFDHASKGRLANSCLEATQLCYYPFANARRAAWQEFGDVIAEGLYTLLHLGLGIQQATLDYWASFLEARRNFLETVVTRMPEAHPNMHKEMLLSVQSALKCSLTIKPDLCELYVQAWRQDLAAWQQRAAGIPTMPSVEAALREMGLKPAGPSNGGRRTLSQRDEAGPDIKAGPVKIPRFDTLDEMSAHVGTLGLSSATSTVEIAIAPFNGDKARGWKQRLSFSRLKDRFGRHSAIISDSAVNSSSAYTLESTGTDEPTARCREITAVLAKMLKLME